MELKRKLAVLADAAKYDASCASSGGKRSATGGKGVGSVTGAGICHSYTPDGRCVSLLKILLTNQCLYDCAFCINRRSSNVERARFSVDEVVTLTLDFYKRNYIEGLFLSSGIIRSADYTMEQVVEVARVLREVHDFRGYIHLKAIAGAAPELLAKAGRHADRLSVNVELPRETDLALYAPEKDVTTIRAAMGKLKLGIEAARDHGVRTRAPSFSPAGQSTQMIVGAGGADDAAIIGAAGRLYTTYGLRRIYYSAFSPIPDSSAALKLTAPPLMREHRLYQADWMIRHYGFAPDEIVTSGGMLDLRFDPKLAWALENRASFPVDINKASRDRLLRVPGLGVKTIDRIIAARRYRTLRLADLQLMARSVKICRAFIITADWRPTHRLDRADLAARLAREPAQLSLFGA